MYAEMNALQDRCETENRKFHSIQRVACVHSAEELEAYWSSLQISKKELEISVLSAQRQIDLLEQERATAEAALLTLKTSDSNHTHASDINDWETKVKDRAKSIETTLQKTGKLREMVNAAVMVVVRIQKRLGEEDMEDINEGHVVQALSRCGDLLLKIQETVPGEVSPIIHSSSSIEKSNGKDGNGGNSQQSRGKAKGKSLKQPSRFLPALFPC